jgi:circadian clock protein KaiC
MRTFSFWDDAAVGRTIFFETVLPVLDQGHALDELLASLVHTVQLRKASLLVFDDYCTLRELHPSSRVLRTFINDLAMAMMALNCTTLLTSSNPRSMRGSTAHELAMCDGLLELAQHDRRGGKPARTLQAWKLRGADSLLGAHTMRIGRDGMTVHPRFEMLPAPTPLAYEPTRVSFGMPGLDATLHGGLARGGITMLAGATGTGKTLLALQFLLAGANNHERSLLVSFREELPALLRKAQHFGLNMAAAIESGQLAIVHCAASERDPDVLLGLVTEWLARTGATRLVIDSVLELERTVPESRKRGVFAALLIALRARGVTALFIRETHTSVGDELDYADSPLELVAENVVLLRSAQRAVGDNDDLGPTLSILKMRETSADRTARPYVLAESFRALAASPPFAADTSAGGAGA